MNLDEIWVADVESDGLLDTITKLHVLSYSQKVSGEWVIASTNDYDKIRRIFTNENFCIAMHNGIRFDVPAIEKVLNIKVKATVIDTLSLAWYVDIGRDRYNLESYGVEFNFPKPPVDDWHNLS